MKSSSRDGSLGFREVYVLDGGLLKCGDALERGPGGAWPMLFARMPWNRADDVRCRPLG